MFIDSLPMIFFDMKKTLQFMVSMLFMVMLF